MRMRLPNLVLGLTLCGGCVGMDEGTDTVQVPTDEVTAEQRQQQQREQPAPRESLVDRDPLSVPSRNGPSVELTHAHTVEPAEDLEVARQAQASLGAGDVRWVEWQHRIALALMVEAGGQPSAERWSAVFDEFDAAVNAPSATQYAHVDELLFDYAALAYRVEDADRGQTALLSLIRSHPRSPFVPYAYAVYADYSFDQLEFENAVQLYTKLEHFNDPSLTVYADYRIGWCRLLDGDDGEALGLFVGVVRAPKEVGGGWGDRLRAAALADATVAYARIDGPDRAREFFDPLARSIDADPEESMRHLARAYRDLGDVESAVQICDALAEGC